MLMMMKQSCCYSSKLVRHSHPTATLALLAAAFRQFQFYLSLVRHPQPRKHEWPAKLAAPRRPWPKRPTEPRARRLLTTGLGVGAARLAPGRLAPWRPGPCGN